MSWKILCVAPALLLGALTACTPSNDDDEGDNPLFDTDGSSGTDSEYTEQEFTLGSPNCNAGLDGSWGSADGYWTSTILYAQKETSSSTSETFSIQIEGDLSVGGVYPVVSISFSEQEAQETPIKYEADGDEVENVTFTVQGFADDTYLFGVLNTDQVILGGTGGSVELTSASYNSWPKFGT